MLKLEELQQDAELERLKAGAAKEKQDEAKGLPERVSSLEKKMGSAGQTWDTSKMMTFSTPDGSFTAKIAGRFYFVHRNVLDAPGATTGAPRDTFTIDTARFQLDGSFYKDFFYRIEGEGKQSSPSAPAGAIAGTAATLGGNFTPERPGPCNLGRNATFLTTVKEEGRRIAEPLSTIHRYRGGATCP